MSNTNPPENMLTKVDVLRALAAGIQNVTIDVQGGDVVYPVETKQSGNNLTVECTDGSVIELTVAVK